MSVVIEVRRATPADAPALATLVQEAHVFHAAALPTVFQPADGVVLTAAEAAAALAADGQLWFVALDAERVVGYAHAERQLTPASRYKRPQARLHVHAMGVTETARGRGAGRALLRAVRAEAAARGLAEVTLEVYAFNAAARALYLGEGFTPVRELLAWSTQDARG